MERSRVVARHSTNCVEVSFSLHLSEWLHLSSPLNGGTWMRQLHEKDAVVVGVDLMGNLLSIEYLMGFGCQRGRWLILRWGVLC